MIIYRFAETFTVLFIYLRLDYSPNDQALKCFVCRRVDYNLLRITPGNKNQPNAIGPIQLKKDYVKRNEWRSKNKRNFDEIDKASVSFGILNPLV